jgi:hypothetical protein
MDVPAAARLTLAAGSARVWERVFLDPPPTKLPITLMEQTVEGVADLARRRVRINAIDAPGWDALAERIRRKWPWLDDSEDDDDDAEFTTVFADGHRFSGTGGRWFSVEVSDREGDPTRILDVLSLARDGDRLGSEEVRGAACERVAFSAPEERGDAWIDAAGLVRRVTWRRPLRVRPRARPKEEPPKLWHTTELWDFGLPVEIEVPEAQPPPDSGPFVRDIAEIGTSLWRRRRDYRRSHGA